MLFYAIWFMFVVESNRFSTLLTNNLSGIENKILINLRCFSHFANKALWSSSHFRFKISLTSQIRTKVLLMQFGDVTFSYKRESKSCLKLSFYQLVTFSIFFNTKIIGKCKGNSIFSPETLKFSQNWTIRDLFGKIAQITEFGIYSGIRELWISYFYVPITKLDTPKSITPCSGTSKKFGTLPILRALVMKNRFPIDRNFLWYFEIFMFLWNF